MMTSKYFNMGTVVVTNGIKEAMAESNLFKLEVFYALDGYSNKNWGSCVRKTRKRTKMLSDIQRTYICLEHIRQAREKLILSPTENQRLQGIIVRQFSSLMKDKAVIIWLYY